jgi:serine/threonine-protein kinase RsbW
VTTTASTTDTRRYTGSYPAEPVQVRQVRAALAVLLPDCPRADDAILIASEYATNSVVHSDSRVGGEFTVRAEVQQNHVRIEIEDGGGSWHCKAGDGSRPHGFDVVAAIAGPGNWGINGDTGRRIAWATLSW